MIFEGEFIDEGVFGVVLGFRKVRGRISRLLGEWSYGE